MKKISKATLQRYPIYLKALKKIKLLGRDKIMSSELALFTSIKSTTIRRDFSLLGTLGKQGYGYDIDSLIEIFSNRLGGNYNEKIILVGAGNFGKAILNYSHWDNIVGEIVCAFDKNPEMCGQLSVPLYNIDELDKKIPDGCHIAIVCVSNDVQEVMDKLVSLNITGIVDFTHEHFIVPKNIHVRSVDVVSTIQELVFATNEIIGG